MHLLGSCLEEGASHRSGDLALIPRAVDLREQTAHAALTDRLGHDHATARVGERDPEDVVGPGAGPAEKVRLAAGDAGLGALDGVPELAPGALGAGELGLDPGRLAMLELLGVLHPPGEPGGGVGLRAAGTAGVIEEPGADDAGRSDSDRVVGLDGTLEGAGDDGEIRAPGRGAGGGELGPERRHPALDLGAVDLLLGLLLRDGDLPLEVADETPGPIPGGAGVVLRLADQGGAVLGDPLPDVLLGIDVRGAQIALELDHALVVCVAELAQVIGALQDGVWIDWHLGSFGWLAPHHRGPRTTRALAPLWRSRRWTAARPIATAWSSWPPGGWSSRLVFSREDGRPINPAYHLTKRLTKIADEAGLPRRRFHDLRHLVATLALEAGVSPKVVAERLGHADPAFTMKTYSHVRAALDEEAAEKIAARLRRD